MLARLPRSPFINRSGQAVISWAHPSSTFRVAPDQAASVSEGYHEQSPAVDPQKTGSMSEKWMSVV